MNASNPTASVAGMPFTGERYVPSVGGQIRHEHLHRYALCLEAVRDRDVLDIACGEGYGSAILAGTARSVTGVDLSDEAVEHARRAYGDRVGLRFVAGRADAIPLPDASVDVVVSFETIEHHDRHEQMLVEIRRVLRPGGRLVISSPDRRTYAASAGLRNEFHVRELDREEFEALLRRHFRYVRVSGQRLGTGSFVHPLDDAAPSPGYRGLTADPAGIVSAGSVALADPVYLIACCSDEPFAADPPSVFVEPSSDLYLEHERIARWARSLHDEREGLIAQRQTAIAERQAAIAERETAVADAAREVARMQEQVRAATVSREAAQADLAETRRRLAADAETLRQRADALRQEAEQWRTALQATHASTSWRMTAPLRRLSLATSASLGGRSPRTAAFGVLRRVFHRLPVSAHARTRLMTAAYTRWPGVFGHLPSYALWKARQDLLRGLAPERDGPVANPGFDPSAPPDLTPPGMLPTCLEPQVSIVIPVYGKVDYTLRCLRSIERHPQRTRFEVLVVDDGSPDGSADRLEGIPGLRLVRNETNLGFIRSCNRGASLARGDYVLMLNNDTEVHPGWLDELVRTFETFPDAGLVGAKLVYPDGRLQESGGIIWRDGSGWNFGRFQDPTHPEFNYARDVDYCSGAAIIVPTALWRELGGFDEHYAPAYGEDSDLAFRVRAAGRRVMVQPASIVTHFEGVTSGTDVGSGVKSYQVVNAQKLRERWQERTAALHPPGENVDAAKDSGVRLRALVLDHCTPTPDRDAGSITALNLMLLLHQAGVHVTFAPEDNFLYMPGYTVAMQRAGIEVLYAPHVTSVASHLARHGGRYDMVLIFRPLVAQRHLQTVREHCARARVVYHTSDLHFLRMEREASLGGDAKAAEQAAAMRQHELSVMRDADAVIVHSTAERSMLAEHLAPAKIHVFAWAIPIRGTRVGFDARSGVAFVGGYQHAPNVDAVRFFVGEVMPLLRERLPGVRFHAIGADAPEALRALAAPDVEITGFVEDLGGRLDHVRVAVAPLRYGAGIKGKLASTLSLGIPSVATSIAVEGMGLRDGEEVLVADDPAAIADAVARLYRDRALWEHVSVTGLAFASQAYGPARGRDTLRGILEAAGLPLPPPRATSGLVGPGGLAEPEVGHRLEPVGQCMTRAEYDALTASPPWRRGRAIEAALEAEHRDVAAYSVTGWCLACGRPSAFLVDMLSGGRRTADGWVPNYRERLECAGCRLNNRQRVIAALMRQRLDGRAEPADVYLMEAVTPVYQWAAQTFSAHRVRGSEYLTPTAPSGTVIDGIRHEDVQAMSFADESLDLIVSNDVFEHVPDPWQGLRECARVLRRGGELLMSIPFDPGAQDSRARAVLRADGVEHLAPPLFHGNPVSADGSLVFTDFGWDVIPRLREAGFEHASVECFLAPRYGHLADGQLVFRATRPA